MQAKCQVDMTYGDIPKQLFMFTIPILLSQILQQFYNIADTAIIGQYVGTDALAAIGSTGLLIAVIVNFFIGLSTGVSAVIANQLTIKVNGEIEGTYSLSEDREIKINDGSNVLQIKNGKAKMIEADCPDKLCMHQKAVSKNHESIICLPNKVVVEVESSENSKYDAVTN